MDWGGKRKKEKGKRKKEKGKRKKEKRKGGWVSWTTKEGERERGGGREGFGD